MLRYFKQFIEYFIRSIPGPLGKKFRYWYYRSQFKSCGENVIIDEGVFFINSGCMQIGSNVWIDKNVILIAGGFQAKKRKFISKGTQIVQAGELHLNDGVHIAPFSLIQAHGGVSIGKNVTIASGAKLYSLSHHYRNLTDKKDAKRYSFSTMAAEGDQFLILGNVIVSDQAAVGLNAVILPGTTVPKGTWLAAGSVINSSSDLKEYSVYSGKNEQ